MLEEIVRQQQDLLGVDGSKYNVEFLSNGSDKHQHHGKYVALLALLVFQSVHLHALKFNRVTICILQ